MVSNVDWVDNRKNEDKPYYVHYQERIAQLEAEAANPDRFPDPILGFMNFDDSWSQSASEGALSYCQSLGIGYAGTSTFSGDDTYLHPHIQKLVDAGVNIIYTNSHENGPALVARNLFDMGLKDKITLATVNRAMDPYVAFAGEKDLDSNGVPVISGMLGSLPIRSWAETAASGDPIDCRAG